MKSILLPLFVSVLFVGVAFGQNDDGPQPVVTLGLARLDLQPVPEGGPLSQWTPLPFTPLKLAITNRTNRVWRFCRFYECLRPILVADTGELVKMPGTGNDVSILPKITDFPIVKPGQSATGSRGCVVKAGPELQFIIADGAGGAFACKVQPGHYKLCLQYQFHHEEHSYFSVAVERFGLNVNAADVWPGWQVSNWIDLYVSKSE